MTRWQSFQVSDRDTPIDSLRHWPSPGVTTTHSRLSHHRAVHTWLPSTYTCREQNTDRWKV
ncbi:hypothetical protein E2C01_068474 [Portunus trituberculatus]|uniref:Uncharacterized protein n=1 Tax=Portunus trituberculatus TaxID=210409 RepID=A0A5B7HWK3_PORTR|nr:hypothetical protein [Portunus trituberculatus]